jgi:hypothetical protein
MKLVTIFLAAVLLAASPLHAEEKSVWRQVGDGVKDTGREVGKAGKEFGQEVGKAGRQFGRDAAEAGKEIGHVAGEAGKEAGTAGKDAWHGIADGARRMGRAIKAFFTGGSSSN